MPWVTCDRVKLHEYPKILLYETCICVCVFRKSISKHMHFDARPKGRDVYVSMVLELTIQCATIPTRSPPSHQFHSPFYIHTCVLVHLCMMY